jgi:hypothetical protein
MPCSSVRESPIASQSPSRVRRWPQASRRLTCISLPRAGWVSTQLTLRPSRIQRTACGAAAAAGMVVIASPNRKYRPKPDALALAALVVESLDELTPGASSPRRGEHASSAPWADGAKIGITGCCNDCA